MSVDESGQRRAEARLGLSRAKGVSVFAEPSGCMEVEPGDDMNLVVAVHAPARYVGRFG